MAGPPSGTAEPILHLLPNGCLIRPFHPTDATALAHEANNSLITKWMRNAFPHPYSYSDATNWIGIATSASPMTDFAICRASDNVLIGAVGLKPQSDVNHRTLELGYWLGQDHWGKGIATAVVTAFTEWSFKNWGNVIRMEAMIFEGNEASKKVLQKAGYGLEAKIRYSIEKNGVVMGHLVFSRFREGW